MPSRKRTSQNILDFIYDYGISSFEEVPFFDLDAAVFAQLAYIEIERCLPINDKFKPARLQLVLSNYLSTVRLEDVEYTLKGDDALALAVMGSKRYKDVEVHRVKKVDSTTENIQFYGIEFILPNRLIVVSYRGTDFSITGWEENADLACYSSISGQKLAATFLQESILEYPEYPFEVVGHSKGGNFAVFAASLLSEEENKRLMNVYSFDGPGLLKEMVDFVGHHRILDKIVHIVPNEDVVGMLFDHEEPNYIVESSASGDFIASHYIMNWKVDGDHFVKAKELTPISKTMSEAFDKLFDDYLSEQKMRLEFFGFFFETINKLGITNPQSVFDSPVNFFLSFSNAVRKSPNKKIFIGFLKAYISYFGTSLMKGKSRNKNGRKK